MIKKSTMVIEDMLELSRISLSELHIHKIDMSALAFDVASDLRTQEPLRDVDIAIEPGMFANGDSGFLSIVMANLICNAWKFTSCRENAHIEVGTLVFPLRGLAFFVRDDGFRRVSLERKIFCINE